MREYNTRLADAHRKTDALETRFLAKIEALEARLNLADVDRAKKELDTSKLSWDLSNLRESQLRLNKDMETIRADIQRTQNEHLGYTIAVESIKRIDDRVKYLETRLLGKGGEGVP